jgi:hypothetical protein
MLPLILVIVALILLGGIGVYIKSIQPVDCITGNWSSWSECDQSKGLQSRVRSILVEPKNNGRSCGSLTETQKCKVDCQVSEWGEWSACDTSKGTQTRTRKVLYQSTNAGKTCPVLSETQKCKVDCKLSEWSAFSACDKQKGKKTRQRTVLQEPINGGEACGPLVELENCRVDCELSKWSDYGPCDPQSGTQTRTRKITIQPLNQGLNCGVMKEVQDCPINCEMNDWNSWSACDSSTGKQFKTRTIKTPPLNGGTECGPQREEQNCNVSCVLSDWGSWGACVQNNSNTTVGTSTRTKDIKVQPLNQGTPCGQRVETKPCKASCTAPNALELPDGSCVPIRNCGSGYYQELTTGACIPNRITLAPAIIPPSQATIDMSGGATALPVATVAPAPPVAPTQTFKLPGQSCAATSDCQSPYICENSICKDKAVPSGGACNGSRRQPFGNTAFKICQSYYNICCPRGMDACLINQYNPSSGDGTCGGEDAY